MRASASETQATTVSMTPQLSLKLHVFLQRAKLYASCRWDGPARQGQLAWLPPRHWWQRVGASWLGFCSSTGSPRDMRTCLKFLKGTNWTMSRRTGSPLGDLRMPSSPSSICMSLKSALPTPTMMTDMGRWEAWTMASRVSAISVMTPSVRISRMKYCCDRSKAR